MRDPLHWMSVRYKLALLFFAVCLLAFGVGGMLVSNYARGALENEIRQRLDFQCRAYASALGARLHLLTRRVEDFASDGYIRDHLDRLAAGPPEEERRLLEEELRRHLVENKLPLVSAFEDLAVVSQDGGRIVSVKDPPSQAHLRVAALAARAEGDWYSGLVPPKDGAGGASFAIAAPVSGLHEKWVIGRLIAWVRPGVWIAGALRGSAPEPEGRILAADLSLADRQGKRLFIPAAFAGPDGPREDSEIARTGFGLRMEAAGSGKEPALPAASEDRYARSFPIASSGWSVHVKLHSGNALLPVEGLQSRFLGMGIALAALAGLLLYFPLRFLARPLVRLRDAARRIQEGAFQTRVDIDSEDEMGDLARAFNHMAKAVEERTQGMEQAARELRAQRDRINTVLSSMQDALIVLDPDGEPVFSNEAARPFLDRMGSKDPMVSSHHLCKEEPRPESCLHCLFSGDGTFRSCVVDLGASVYEVHATPLPPDYSGRSGKVLVGRNITDRISQDERQIHQERLAVLGEVAAIMAHELNNPLAAISMFNQMVADDLPGDSPLKEHLEVIQRNTATCKQTIGELLDYATGATPEVGTIDLDETIEEVVHFLMPVSHRYGIEIGMDLGLDGATITGDEIQIRQIFINLLMNAFQAMDGGGGEIRISTRRQGELLYVEVTDSGPGIPAGSEEEIFRPFFTTKPRGEGTGLGLPTSRRIAEMHGGGLELLHSEPGRTTFRIRFRGRRPKFEA
ncbi:MAG: PAS domain-containing sensor histidine kinase [Planctomycetota bacterium]